MVEEKSVVGLAGWLRLIGFLAVAGPLYLTYIISTAYVDAFTSGLWQQITSPQTQGYHPLLAPIFIADVIVILAILAMSAHAMNLFFQRSRRFPPLFMKINATIVAVFIVKHLVLTAGVPARYVIDANFWIAAGIYGALVLPMRVLSKRA